MGDNTIISILAAGLILGGIYWFFKHYKCTKIDETPEAFRGGRRGGWGRWGGWRGDRWRGWRGGYPDYWGGWGYEPVYSWNDCIPFSKDGICPVSRPNKIGYDTNGDGISDAWQCCG